MKGKNSADIQIVVDVMEYIARIPDLEWVVLATGDSDFSPLFRRLRELGKSVVGVGPRSALSEAVKKSCNRFIYIDEERQANNSSKAPLRDEAMELLERIVDKFPDGISLSTLKNEMLEIDSAFDEKDLGFSGFMKFLQSAPEIVCLYESRNVWHAKPFSTVDKVDKLPGNAVTLLKPTTDLYKRSLRQSGWKACESSFLWDALTKLERRFPKGFTRSEEFDYLLESFGHSRTRGEFRAVMYILYKAGFVIQQPSNQQDDPILIAKTPDSERAMSKIIDSAMLHRLFSICKSQNISFAREFVYPLLNNTYTKEQFEKILEQVQN